MKRVSDKWHRSALHVTVFQILLLSWSNGDTSKTFSQYFTSTNSLLWRLLSQVKKTITSETNVIQIISTLSFCSIRSVFKSGWGLLNEITRHTLYQNLETSPSKTVSFKMLPFKQLIILWFRISYHLSLFLTLFQSPMEQ